MHLSDPVGVTVDPARARAFLADEDRRQRSARALVAAAARYVDRRAVTEARLREALLSYRATARHPLDGLVMPFRRSAA